MGVKIDISNFKCLNQLRNGEDFDQNLTEFTPNLVGNVGERVRISFTAALTVESESEGSETWDMLDGRIERSTGNFKDDGLLEGNSMAFFHNWQNRFDLTNLEFSATIDGISSDGTVLLFTVTSGTQTTVGEAQDVGIFLNQGNPLNNSTASLLKFGLIGNDESFNFISKTSAGQQIFYAIEIIGGPPIEYDSLGKLKDWVTGSSTIELLTPPDFFTFKYEIVHEFVLNPWFILEFKVNLLNNTVPDLLEGDNSLKYAFELEFRQTLTDIASKKSAITEDIEGVVGWFGENFNGFNNDYLIDSIAYEDDDTSDPLDGIGINNNTKVTVVVSRKAGSITTDFSASVHISVLPVAESQYQQTETDLIENFLFDSLTLANPDTSNTGTGIIKSVNSSISAGKLTLTYVITYATLDKLRLTEETEYMTWIQIEDSTISTGNSDRVAILADLRNYTDANFVADFLNFTEYDFFTHELERGVDNPKTAITDGINEDGIALSTRFSSDASKNVVINTVRHVLISRNTVTGIFFELDSYDIDISATITDGNGVQQFTVQVGRGYDLLATDQFNLVELLTKNLVGNDQFYEGYFGQKIKWQDWLSNALVDTVFFNSAESNDNLNFKTSNYSEVNNYEIFLATIINVSGDDDLGRNVTGDFIELGTKIIVDDYSSEPLVTGVIETFDPDTLQSLGGAVLYNGKDTIFKTTYTRSLIELVDYAIHRIEPALSAGNGIQELSSKLPFPDSNIIIPLSGETLLKVTEAGGTVTTESLISGAKVQEGINYKLSSRLAQGLAPAIEFIYSVTVSASETISLPMFSGDDSLYDFIVNFGDGSGDKAVDAYGDADREHEYVGAGTFDITITGQFDYIKFADSPSSIIELKSFGNTSIGIQSFLNCDNLTTMSATDTPGMNDTSLEGAIQGCTLLSNITSINSWDVSTIDDMEGLFRDSPLFNNDIGNWITSSVTTMERMFQSASAFNQDVGAWNTSSVTTMVRMFQSAIAFNQDIGSWVTSSVTLMEKMFQSAAAFNQNIGSWNVTIVTDIEGMFLGATAFNGNIGLWTTTVIDSLFQTFNNATSFDQDISGWDTSNVTTIRECFDGATAFDQDISGWDTSSVTNMVSAFQGATSFDQDLGTWDVTALTTALLMFQAATLSTANYDALLVGWEAQAVNNNVPLHGGNSTFTSAGAGGTARAALIADHSWTITDGGGI